MKKLYTLVAILVLLIFFTVLGQTEKYFNYDKKNSSAIEIKQVDPVGLSIDAIKHQGKLVVVDIDLSASSSSVMESKIFDAKSFTTATAHTQVGLDLAMVTREWTRLEGSTLHITVPLSAIKSNHIYTSVESKNNGSYAFYWYNTLSEELYRKDRSSIEESISKQQASLRDSEAPLVAAQLARLFQTILTPMNIKVDASIDSNH